MDFRTIETTLPWTDKTQWFAPSADEKMIGTFAPTAGIELWLGLCTGYDVAIQAGGAIGVWASRFALDFKQVYTFEPDPENYACLVENCQAENVTRLHAGLSNEHKTVRVHRLPGQINNYGAGYIVDDPNGIDTICIDDLELDACDLICLDIEGAELDALKGAEETIKRFKPLIVLEDKPMPQLGTFKRAVGDPGRWLEQFGYTFQLKDRWDSIYKC